MNINSNEKIIGFPILEIRKLLRRGKGNSWGLDFVQRVLEIDNKAAIKLVRELERLDFIQKDNTFPNKKYWHNSIKGNALALASALKPFSFKIAEQKLADFVNRVQIVNSSDYYLYKIEKVAIFGSYLKKKEFLSDIDIAIQLKPKEKNKDIHFKLEEEYRKLEKATGRRFNNLTEYLAWPQIAVFKFLKSRSRYISLHEFEELALLKAKYKLIDF